jgi:hypothetical protein
VLLAVSLSALTFFGVVSWRFGFNPSAADLIPHSAFPRAEMFALIPLGCVLFGEFLRNLRDASPRFRPLVESAAVVVALAVIVSSAIWNPAYDKQRQLLVNNVPEPKDHLQPTSASAANVAEQVRDWVLQHSERARRFGSAKVFVCGFGGYVHFHEPPSRDYSNIRDARLFVNTLDFDFETTVQDYRGQDLYLLVPEPVGLAAFDSIHWKFPQVFEGRSAPRLLFDRDFNGWRLFEIVRSPSEDAPRR